MPTTQIADEMEEAVAEAAPGLPYDEMHGPDGSVRAHYAALAKRLDALGPGELDERQRTLERFFLLQGITFTVYGAESSTERIIPTDLLPRIIPAPDVARPAAPMRPTKTAAVVATAAVVTGWLAAL